MAVLIRSGPRIFAHPLLRGLSSSSSSFSGGGEGAVAAPRVVVSVRESAGRTVREASFDVSRSTTLASSPSSLPPPPSVAGAAGGAFELSSDLRLETGRIAPLADGSVTVRAGRTVLLSTAVSSRDPPKADFFALTVDAREKFYATGKIPQNFMRRELRQSDAEILRSRLVDRAIRPLFPPGYMQETQVILSLLSGDDRSDLETLCVRSLLATAAAAVAAHVAPPPPLVVVDAPSASAAAGRRCRPAHKVHQRRFRRAGRVRHPLARACRGGARVQGGHQCWRGAVGEPGRTPAGRLRVQPAVCGDRQRSGGACVGACVRA
jgi:hypothetical protein